VLKNVKFEISAQAMGIFGSTKAAKSGYQKCVKLQASVKIA
jgi:hypothetical protein